MINNHEKFIGLVFVANDYRLTVNFLCNYIFCGGSISFLSCNLCYKNDRLYQQQGYYVFSNDL